MDFTKYLYRRPEHLRKRVPSTVARRRVYDYFHDVRDQLLPLRPLRERLLPLHRIEPEPLRNARFKGIIPR